jgi:hypothetical protein
MKSRKQFCLLFALCCAMGLALLPPASRANVQGSRYVGRDITGTVVGVGGRLGGRSRPFRLIIERYTSPEEVQRLTAALQGGQDEALRAISKMSAGRIQVGNGVGLPANVIIPMEQAEGGTKLVVIFQRDLSIYELRRGTRSEDYRFGYAELYMGRRGGNEGTFIPAAKVRLRDGNTWEVEDFGVFPARLMGLQARGGGRAR